MANLKDYEFFICEDGIYFAKELKNGSMSKDARKVENNEVVQLFCEVLEDYCLRTGKPLLIEREGRPAIEARIIIREAGGDALEKEE